RAKIFPPSLTTQPTTSRAPADSASVSKAILYSHQWRCRPSDKSTAGVLRTFRRIASRSQNLPSLHFAKKDFSLTTCLSDLRIFLASDIPGQWTRKNLRKD